MLCLPLGALLEGGGIASTREHDLLIILIGHAHQLALIVRESLMMEGRLKRCIVIIILHMLIELMDDGVFRNFSILRNLTRHVA